MTDELNAGVAESTTVPASEQAKEAQVTAGQADTKAGAAPDVLAQKVDGLEKLMGKWGNELGELRQVAQALLERRQAVADPMPRQPEQTDEFDDTAFLTKPKETISKVVQAELGKFRQTYEDQRKRTDAQEALGNFKRGFDTARGQNPELYEGLEGEIANDLRDAYNAGIIDKHTLLNPEIYLRTARLKRLDRGEFDKVIPAKRSAPLTATEVPGKGRQAVDADDDDVSLDDDAKAYAKMRGWTDKEAVEILKGEQAAVRKGLNKR